MPWEQVYTIIGVNVALFAILITVIIWMVTKLDSDVRSCMSRLDGHASRIDQLYEMFVNLLKDRKN